MKGFVWLPKFDFLAEFLGFWFGSAFDDRALQPVPVRARRRRHR